jgi:hypothetical protein
MVERLGGKMAVKAQILPFDPKPLVAVADMRFPSI